MNVQPYGQGNTVPLGNEANGSLVTDHAMYHHLPKQSEYRAYSHLTSRSPAEILGSVVVRPLIDATYSYAVYSVQAVRNGFTFMATMLSKPLSIIPGAAAETHSQDGVTAYEMCTTLVADKIPLALQIAGDSENPSVHKTVVETFKALAEVLLPQCERNINYVRAKIQYDANFIYHNSKIKEREENLKKYQQSNGASVKILDQKEAPPDIFTDKSGNWVSTQGYLYWSIGEEGYASNTKHARGGYNFDISAMQPTVPTTKDYKPHDK